MIINEFMIKDGKDKQKNYHANDKWMKRMNKPGIEVVNKKAFFLFKHGSCWKKYFGYF